MSVKTQLPLFLPFHSVAQLKRRRNALGAVTDQTDVKSYGVVFL